MKINIKTLIPVILFSLGIGWMIGAALDVNNVIKFKRADDGTPCYTFGNQFECNFDQANVKTDFGRYSYPVDSTGDIAIDG